jgi:hypothetical protein
LRWIWEESPAFNRLLDESWVPHRAVAAIAAHVTSALAAAKLSPRIRRYAGRFDAAEAVQTLGAAFPSGASGFLQHFQPPQFWKPRQLPHFSAIRPIDADAGGIAGKRRPEWRPQSALSNRRTALGATGSETPLLSAYLELRNIDALPSEEPGITSEMKAMRCGVSSSFGSFGNVVSKRAVDPQLVVPAPCQRLKGLAQNRTNPTAAHELPGTPVSLTASCVGKPVSFEAFPGPRRRPKRKSPAPLTHLLDRHWPIG